MESHRGRTMAIQDIYNLYDRWLVLRITDQIEKDGYATIPFSDLLLLLPLSDSPKERGYRVAKANGLRMTVWPDIPFVFFEKTEDEVVMALDEEAEI